MNTENSDFGSIKSFISAYWGQITSCIFIGAVIISLVGLYSFWSVFNIDIYRHLKFSSILDEGLSCLILFSFHLLCLGIGITIRRHKTFTTKDVGLFCGLYCLGCIIYALMIPRPATDLHIYDFSGTISQLVGAVIIFALFHLPILKRMLPSSSQRFIFLYCFILSLAFTAAINRKEAYQIKEGITFDYIEYINIDTPIDSSLFNFRVLGSIGTTLFIYNAQNLKITAVNREQIKILRLGRKYDTRKPLKRHPVHRPN